MNAIISNLISIFVTAIVAFSVGHFVGGNPNLSKYFSAEEVVEDVIGVDESTELLPKYASISEDEASNYSGNYRVLNKICGNTSVANYIDLDLASIKGLALAAKELDAEYGDSKPEKYRLVYGINPVVSELSDASIYKLIIIPVTNNVEDLEKIKISEDAVKCFSGCEKSEFVWKAGQECLEQ
jgi:hypothetical protein